MGKEEDLASISSQIRKHKGFLSARELAQIMGVCRGTIFRKAAKRQIPSYKFGLTLRFDPKAVADWLESKNRE